nr:PGF-pre-PGF domain-containing protein [Halorubrum sp. CSM-61]
MKRYITAFVLLALVGAFMLPSAAAAFTISQSDTLANDDLAVQPADGPNGQYAYLNDDDEIAIDVSASNPNIRDPSFEGVSVGTTGTVDDVFTITYTGDEYAHAWIDHSGENVTFVTEGDSIEGEANNVTLAPDETVAVGLALDARGTAAGTTLGADEFSIRAEIAEPESVPSTSSSSTGDGDPITTVTSPSDDRREFTASDIDRGETVRFEADGMHLDGGNVTLDRLDVEGVRADSVEVNADGSRDPFANESALDAPTTPRSIAYLGVEHDFGADEVDAMTVRFSASRERLDDAGIDPENVTFYRQTDGGEWTEKGASVVGEETIESRGLPEDRVHFRATTDEFSTFAVAERVPRFDATEATLDTPAIDPGEEATVRATVENGGGVAGERTVTLTVDDDPVANETVALAPNETATLALSAAFETAGEYDLAVSGTDAGTLLVGDPAGTDGDSVGDGDASGGGDGDARSATGGEGTDGSGGGPIEEPAGIDLTDLGRLLALSVLAVAGVELLRRISRP